MEGLLANSVDTAGGARKELRKVMESALRKLTRLAHCLSCRAEPLAGDASGNENAKISWTHFETEVSLRYHVHLRGYAVDSIVDPNNMSRARISILLPGLVSKSIAFVKMTEDEWQDTVADVLRREKYGEKLFSTAARRTTITKDAKARPSALKKKKQHLTMEDTPSDEEERMFSESDESDASDSDSEMDKTAPPIAKGRNRKREDAGSKKQPRKGAPKKSSSQHSTVDAGSCTLDQGEERVDATAQKHIRKRKRDESDMGATQREAKRPTPPSHSQPPPAPDPPAYNGEAIEIYYGSKTLHIDPAFAT